MESRNRLGIYISRDTATVVCLDAQGVMGCFSVSVEEPEKANMQELARLISEGCAERGMKFSEVAVALDCAMFMQHSVHSEFNDPKQIAATVKFDTEEALATDITDVALAFEIISRGQTDSKLTVFTAERKVLSEVLLALQQYNLDPMTIEPDVNCLSRFINRKINTDEIQHRDTLVGVLSRQSGYLVFSRGLAGEQARKVSAVRSFLIGPTQNREELLSREVLVTTALIDNTEPIKNLKVFDSTLSLKNQRLNERLGIEVDTINLCDAAGIELQAIAACTEQVDFTIAYGAALVYSEKERVANFRDDFSPFQGKKLRLQKTLRFAAISVTVLLIAVGLYFHTQLFSLNRYNNEIRNKFAKEYSAVTLEKLQDNDKLKDAVRKLGTLLRRIEREKKGLITDEKSISSKLRLVLAAFNKSASQTNLNVNSITITTRDIIITGDTSSRQNTEKFFDVVKNSGLEILREGYDLKGGRDNFSITVVPKK